jgi:hypothetical protein
MQHITTPLCRLAATALALCIIAVLGSTASAATVIVDSGGGGDSATIGGGLALAGPGDTVEVVDSATYTEFNLTVSTGVTLLSTQVPAPTITFSLGFTLVTLDGGVIDGFSLTNSGLNLGPFDALHIPALENAAGGGEVSNCVFSNNDVAIQLVSGGGHVDVIDCTFNDNVLALTTDTGTSISVDIEGCMFSSNGNSSAIGFYPNNGAIVIRSEFSNITIDGCYFDTNETVNPNIYSSTIDSASSIWAGDQGGLGTGLIINGNHFEGSNDPLGVSIGNIEHFEFTNNEVELPISFNAGAAGGSLGDDTSVVSGNSFVNAGYIEVAGPVEATFNNNLFVATQYVLNGTRPTAVIVHHTFTKPASLTEAIVLDNSTTLRSGPPIPNAIPPNTPTIRDHIFAGFPRGVVRTEAGDSLPTSSNFPDVGNADIDMMIAVHNVYDATDLAFNEGGMVDNNNADPRFVDWANDDYLLDCDAPANVLNDASDSDPMGAFPQVGGCEGGGGSVGDCIPCVDLEDALYDEFCNELFNQSIPSIVDACSLLNQLVDSRLAEVVICSGDQANPAGIDTAQECKDYLFEQINTFLISVPAATCDVEPIL